LGNAVGVHVLGGAGTTTIGTLNTNVISGNGTGILVEDPPTLGPVTVSGNYIGTATNGTSAMGNSGYGVRSVNGAPRDLSILDNTIAFNGTGGVGIGGVGDAIRGNAIYSNGGRAIDL